ncbi:MAG TPA: hypothetical protein VK249_15650 [Anaerolineales bacterium]|nr:hypothetical protein [Anaerolineales bacterium]
MIRSVKIIFLLSLTLGIYACSPAPSALQPTPAQAFHPLRTRTGITELDMILQVVADQDLRTLRSFIQLTTAKCTRQDGLGGPPKCREGEAEGTPVEVLPFLGPEGGFLHKDEIGSWPGFQAIGLYAIYRVSENAYSDENYPAGKYAIMFVAPAREPATSLRISAGRIVRVDFLFDNSPESLNEWIQREAAKVIVAPVTRAQ